MKKELKSDILSADKSADCRPTVGGVNVIVVLAVEILTRSQAAIQRIHHCHIFIKKTELQNLTLPKNWSRSAQGYNLNKL